MTRRAVFLDRDGVLNKALVEDGSPRPPRTYEELSIPEDVAPSLARLRKAGFLNIVVTNQPDVPRGKTARDFVEDIHAKLRSRLPLDAVYVCWHDDADACDCRKPKPGMLLQASRDLGIDLHSSYMVGDRWKDIEAGRNAGCATIFLENDYEMLNPSKRAGFSAGSVAEAVQWILERETQTGEAGK